MAKVTFIKTCGIVELCTVIAADSFYKQTAAQDIVPACKTTTVLNGVLTCIY